MNPINNKVYRAVFDLHKTALAMLDSTPIDSLWEWYWNQAHAILDANTGDQFVIDLLIAVAGDVERRQIELRDAGRITA